MPSQLINNEALYFMCARDFTFNGKDYKMGDKFPQEKSLGRIDTLVRTRRLVVVVDDGEDKPRHWHHHVWLRSEITKKLGLIHREDSQILEGSSLYNKPLQTAHSDASDSTTPEVRDESQELWEAQNKAILERKVLAQKNDEDDAHDPSLVATDENGDPIEVDGVVQTETPDRINPGEGNDLDEVEFDEDGDPVEEEEVTEDDLYDPSEHNAPEVLEYLTGDITEEEKARVIAAERSGKARKGVLDNV